MGNTECCREAKDREYVSQIVDPVQLHSAKEEPLPPVKQEASPQKEKLEESKLSIEVVDQEYIEIPNLPASIRQRVEQEQFFAEHLKGEMEVRRFGNEVYQGQLDEEGKYPHGWGRMYKVDGAYFAGHFQHGMAEGQGVYLSPDGLFYKGHFHNNCAQGEGRYEANGVTYEGHFLKNLFHGEGKETTKEYEFQGEFYEGNKTQGVFKWTDKDGKEYVYTGRFNFKNQFHGQGVLVEPNGTYSGSFIDGQKHGNGVYKFNSGLRYEGQYQKGRKKGKGIIYNFNNSIAYEGEFDNDMPHGKGFVYDNTGTRHETTWVEGIDSTFL